MTFQPGSLGNDAPSSRTSLHSRLRAHRVLRRWTQAQLAERTGISRQAYGSIERGESVPSVEVALRLARVLEVKLEEVFRLGEPEEVAEAELLPWGPGIAPGHRVQVATVGDHRVAIPVEGPGFPEPEPASGVVEEVSDRGVGIRRLAGAGREPALVLCGCDPATQLLRHFLRDDVELAWIPAGSRQALEALAGGRAHVAGFHLGDGQDSPVREVASEMASAQASGPPHRLPFPATVVGFAVWEQGLLLSPGNPLGVQSVEDLSRPGLRLLNREVGSGSRALLDGLLDEAGIPGPSVAGYWETSARGHWAVAEGVTAGVADVGVGIRAAARAFGLDWILLREERYDLIIPDHLLDHPGVGALLDLLGSPALRAQVESLGGYDLSIMGEPA